MKYFLLLSAFVFATVHASAQCNYGGTDVGILNTKPIKIKVVTGVSSATARVGDYVEFKTMEKIYSATNPPKVLFDKETPVYAIVSRRKHRHFPFFGGKLELKLESLVNWDGKEIHMAIQRHGVPDPKRTGKDRLAINKACKEDGETNCVAGRRNSSTAKIVPSVAAGGSGAVATLAEDKGTRIVAATSFFLIAKEVEDLLNGTDATIDKDEIFDLVIQTNSTCALPPPEQDGREKLLQEEELAYSSYLKAESELADLPSTSSTAARDSKTFERDRAKRLWCLKFTTLKTSGIAPTGLRLGCP